MLKEASPAYLIRGKVVQEDGTAPDRYLLIRDGRIVSISRRRPPHSKGVVPISTRNEDWIFPGLLDLHSHTSYNLLPLWKAPGAPYPNRFAWRGDARYEKDIVAMYDFLKRVGVDPKDRRAKRARRKMLAAFSELQAVAGGTTTLQESFSLECQEELSEPVLCRGTATPIDLGLSEEERVFSVVDFFRPGDDGRPAPVDREIDRYLKYRAEGRLCGTLAHLAEGRSGFGSDRGVDEYSRAELEAFMAHPAFADAAEVRRSPLAIIHGCGIDTADERHLEFLRERGISVVWSPVSNLLLYGETIDVEALVDAGIDVVIGSDWSPSGSKHVWDEAKFARFYFEAIGSAVSDVQVFQMVTANAARSLSVHSADASPLGRLVRGAMADLFILHSPLETDNALEVFFKATDRHVIGVFIDGVPRYGEKDFLQRFEPRLQRLPLREGRAVRGKAVHLPPELTNVEGETLDVDRDLTRLEDQMKAPPPPLAKTRRSNLLASSDGPYRRRLIELRQETIAYGGRVQQWIQERFPERIR